MGIVELEQRVLSMQVVEQAFICQNINLALQAMGLGGWTYTGYIARFALGGMDVPGLGFRFADAKRGPSVPVGRDGVFEAFTPPYHADMGEAVDAFLEAKWSQYEPTSPRPTRSPTGSSPRSCGPTRTRSRSSRTTASTSTTPTGASRPTSTRCTSA